MESNIEHVKLNNKGVRLTFSSNQFRKWLFVAGFAYSPLASFVSGFFHQLPIIGSYSDYVVPTIMIILIGLNLSLILRSISVKDLLALFIFASILIFSYALYPENSQYINQNIGELLLHATPYYFLGLIWNDDRDTFLLIYKVSLVAIVVNALYFVLFISRSDQFIYSMTIAYAILPSIMVCLWWLVKEKRKLAIAGVGIGIFLLIFLGTRGPVVVFICYSVFLLWNKFRIKGKILMILVATSFVYLIMNTSVIDNMMQSLALFGGSRGYSTRIFDILHRNEMFSYTSGRSEYYEIVIQKISERPFLGYGIYGEWQFIQNPAHRIWLEVWSHYGVFLGTIFMAYFISLMYRGVKYSSNEYIKGFIWIWIVHLLVRGIFGSTYLGFYCFFLWGLCCNQIRKNKYFHNRQSYPICTSDNK